MPGDVFEEIVGMMTVDDIEPAYEDLDAWNCGLDDDSNDFPDWCEVAVGLDEGIIAGRKKELAKMEEFGLGRLIPRSEASKHIKLKAGWVQQMRPDGWRCRYVAKEFKTMDPEKEGLFTASSGPTTGRAIDCLRPGVRDPGLL